MVMNYFGIGIDARMNIEFEVVRSKYLNEGAGGAAAVAANNAIYVRNGTRAVMNSMLANCCPCLRDKLGHYEEFVSDKITLKIKLPRDINRRRKFFLRWNIGQHRIKSDKSKHKKEKKKLEKKKKKEQRGVTNTKNHKNRQLHSLTSLNDSVPKDLKPKKPKIVQKKTKTFTRHNIHTRLRLIICFFFF